MCCYQDFCTVLPLNSNMRLITRVYGMSQLGSMLSSSPIAISILKVLYNLCLPGNLTLSHLFSFQILDPQFLKCLNYK